MTVNESKDSVAFMAHAPREPRVAPGSHGDIVALVSAGLADTTAGLARLTGLARSTITSRVAELSTLGYLTEAGPGPGTSAGRPARRIRLNTADTVVLAVDLGASHCRMAVMDTSRAVLQEREITLEDPRAAPGDILPVIERHLRDLLGQAGKPDSAVRAIGMGVPAPIEYATGKPADPPILGHGWNGYPIPEFFRERFGSHVPVLVDNDVNVMALGEHRLHRASARDLMVVKVGTGIGCGIISGGELHRGAQGCAGDIGHIQVTGKPLPLCHCGKTGCLEALAGGAALARALSEAGHPASTPIHVIRLAADSDPAALRALQDAGKQVGGVLAALVNFFNPEAIVIAGALSQSHHLIAAINGAVHQRSLALATTRLRIESALAGPSAAVTGAGILAIEHILNPADINERLAPDRAPRTAG